MPGQIYADKSEGCNNLIREGATLIKNVSDVLNEYSLAAQEEKISSTEKNFTAEKISPTEKISAPRSEIILTGDAEKVFELIPRDKYITEDEILNQLEDLNPSELPRIMLELDMKGCVEEDAGRYKRKVGG